MLFRSQGTSKALAKESETNLNVRGTDCSTLNSTLVENLDTLQAIMLGEGRDRRPQALLEPHHSTQSVLIGPRIRVSAFQHASTNQKRRKTIGENLYHLLTVRFKLGHFFSAREEQCLPEKIVDSFHSKNLKIGRAHV